jgi:hypothetical protein
MSILPRCICDPLDAIIGKYDPRCSRHLGTPRPTLAPPSIGDYLGHPQQLPEEPTQPIGDTLPDSEETLPDLTKGRV